MQPTQITMDEVRTCNLQKNQQSSTVRVPRRIVQRSKAVLPASKRNLVSIYVCFYS